jgi:hypothetical protein
VRAGPPSTLRGPTTGRQVARTLSNALTCSNAVV